MKYIKYLKDRVQGKAPAGKRRSSQWSRVRKEHLTLNPLCAVCGGSKSVEVHYIVPFHVNPDLELESSNLIFLCESKKGGVTCHLFVGHLGNYKHSNPEVRGDAKTWLTKLKTVRASNEIKKSEVPTDPLPQQENAEKLQENCSPNDKKLPESK